MGAYREGARGNSCGEVLGGDGGAEGVEGGSSGVYDGSSDGEGGRGSKERTRVAPGARGSGGSDGARLRCRRRR